MDTKTLVIIFAAVCVVTLLSFMFRRKCLFKGLFATVIQGISALYAVKLIGTLTGVSLAVNWYTLGTAAVLGSPGVALMLAAEALFMR